jgi:hypothetical protein
LPALAKEDASNDLYYYEVQISFLIIGVDECVYTSYCLVDTYYPDSEPDHRKYLEPPHILEPAAGGHKDLRFPLWNPREFFLCILSIRLEQLVQESQALLNEFEERMNAYVSSTISQSNPFNQKEMQRDEADTIFTDDRNLSRTKKLMKTVSTVERFQHCYIETIRAWETFERDDIRMFEFIGMDALRPRWNDYFYNIKGSIAELRTFTMRLDQYLGLFNRMKDGVRTFRSSRSIPRGQISTVGIKLLIFVLHCRIFDASAGNIGPKP